MSELSINKRLDKIINQCHDQSVRHKTAEACGKRIPNLLDVAELFQAVSDLAKIVKEDTRV